MKGIYKSIILFLALFISGNAVMAQCSSVIVEAFGMNPQSGAYNFYGVRVTLLNTYHTDITVTGYIHRDVDEENNQDHPFTLTVTPGNTVVETPVNFYQTDPVSGASVTIASISTCPANEIVQTYAGVSIVYEVDNNILRFNSQEELEAVINQLEEDYENYNNAYESNYENLTAEELDAIDEQTGFDEFHTYRVFENLFQGFYTKRMEFESMEDSWLATNMEGVDPDDYDLTFDESENTLFNSDYSLKVGSDVYQLTTAGLVINGELQASVNGVQPGRDLSMASAETMTGNPLDPLGIMDFSEVQHSGPSVGRDGYFTGNDLALGGGCKSNKKDKLRDPFGDTRFKKKVAINSIAVRSSAKGKVVHYKKINGNWKRKRTKMAVWCGGTVYNNQCSGSFQFDNRNPASGWKKRRQLKMVRRQAGQIWRTWPNQLYSSYLTESGYTGSIILNF